MMIPYLKHYTATNRHIVIFICPDSTSGIEWRLMYRVDCVVRYTHHPYWALTTAHCNVHFYNTEKLWHETKTCIEISKASNRMESISRIFKIQYISINQHQLLKISLFQPLFVKVHMESGEIESESSLLYRNRYRSFFLVSTPPWFGWKAWCISWCIIL